MTTEHTQPCPHCGREHNVSRSLHNDRIWCMFCGKWFVVIWRTDGTQFLAKCDPPRGA